MLELADSGNRLMLDSLDIMASLERRYAERIGEARFAAMLRGLVAFGAGAGNEVEPD